MKTGLQDSARLENSQASYHNVHLTNVLYSADPYFGYLKGVFGLWIQYGTWTNNGYNDGMFQVMGSHFETARFIPAYPYFDNTPLGEDMTSLSDWLYQFNKTWNSLAVFSNTISTYATGADTYGVEQSNSQATVQLMVAFFPVGKLSNVTTSAASNLWKVGAYNELRGLEIGLDAHHVGQKALMEKFIPGYNRGTAPSILVPKPGHTQGIGVLSRNMSGFTNARQVLARDIFELRRVYGPYGIPNSSLQELIQMNKTMYPAAFVK